MILKGFSLLSPLQNQTLSLVYVPILYRLDSNRKCTDSIERRPRCWLTQHLFHRSKLNKCQMSYKHLSREERYTISTLRRKGYPRSSIAATLGRNISTIKRELKRNATAEGGYRYEHAQKLATNKISPSFLPLWTLMWGLMEICSGEVDSRAMESWTNCRWA